jgi:hypothetical protein
MWQCLLVSLLFAIQVVAEGSAERILDKGSDGEQASAEFGQWRNS